MADTAVMFVFDDSLKLIYGIWIGGCAIDADRPRGDGLVAQYIGCLNI